MRADQKATGIVLNYLTEGIKVLTALLYTPLMLRLLGQREYGLYQMAVSVVSWLGLLNLGFGSGYLRCYSRYRAAGEDQEIARLNGMFLLIFSAMSLLCLLCGGVLSAHAETVFGADLTAEELGRARRLLGLLVGNLALNLLNTVFDCHITARERFMFQKLLRLAQTLLSPFLTLPLLVMGHASDAVAGVSLVLTAAVLGGNAVYCGKGLRMGFSFRKLQLSRLKALWQFTFFILLHQIIDQVNWSVDKFLLGRMCGTESVAVYGVGAQINTLYLQMSIAISGIFLPEVNRLAAQSRDNGPLSRLMGNVGKLQAAILGLVLTGFALFGRPFVRLWVGEGYEEAYAVALLLMGSMTIPLMQNLGIEIQRARNRHRARSLVCACLAVGNVALSITLIPRWGCIGAAAGTAVAVLLGNVAFMNWYYHRCLQLDMVQFWREILPLLPAWTISVGVGLLLRTGWQITGWASLFAAVLLYSAVYALAVFPAIKKKWGQA